MKRRWWTILILIPLVIPFASILDTLLWQVGYQNTDPFIVINLWEYTIFISGIFTGYILARREFKPKKVKTYSGQEFREFV